MDEQQNALPQEELDYTPDLITLEDEAGQEHQCEVIDTVDHNGEHYLAVVPYVEDPEKMLEEDAQLIIMRVAEENGEEFLDIVEDDEELAAVSEVFAARLEELEIPVLRTDLSGVLTLHTDGRDVSVETERQAA